MGWDLISMMVRVVEQDGLLCPFVVCGGCDEVIRVGQAAIVFRNRVRGNVEDEAFHEGVCAAEPKAGVIKQWRSLNDWLTQLHNNSVGA